MTKFKYILIILTVALLLVGALVLFIFGLHFSEMDADLSIALYVGCGILITIAFVIIFLNHKKLVAFDKRILFEKLKDKDYTCVDFYINENDCRAKLKANGYQYYKYSINILHKQIEDTCGDGYTFYHYNAKIIRVNNVVDIDDILVGLNKGPTTYNFACIYIEENIEKNLSVLKDYIKQSIVDNEVHRYKYKCFFVPIIFVKDKVYYLKAGSFYCEYQIALKEIIKILGIEK